MSDVKDCLEHGCKQVQRLIVPRIIKGSDVKDLSKTMPSYWKPKAVVSWKYLGESHMEGLKARKLLGKS